MPSPTHRAAHLHRCSGSVVGSASRLLLRVQSQRDRAKVEWKVFVFQIPVGRAASVSPDGD